MHAKCPCCDSLVGQLRMLHCSEEGVFLGSEIEQFRLVGNSGYIIKITEDMSFFVTHCTVFPPNLHEAVIIPT